MKDQRPATARRIRSARERAGLSPETVASNVGLTPASYYDLEAYDDEAFTVLSLRELRALARELGVSAGALVTDHPEAPRPLAPLPPVELVARIRQRIQDEQIDVGVFGDRVGWDVADLVDDPQRLWDDWCVDALRDVCAELGLDWLAVLSNESDHS